MENKFRNEMEITLGEHKVLLRPTFENIAAMEGDLGSVAFLTWKLSRGITIVNGQVDRTSFNSEAAVRGLPSLTDCAKIIYYNQATLKQDGSKQFSLEEIWQMVMEHGAGVSTPIVQFIGRLTSGDKSRAVEEVSEAEKKS